MAALFKLTGVPTLTMRRCFVPRCCSRKRQRSLLRCPVNPRCSAFCSSTEVAAPHAVPPPLVGLARALQATARGALDRGLRRRTAANLDRRLDRGPLPVANPPTTLKALRRLPLLELSVATREQL